MIWVAEHVLTAINHAKPRDCFTREDVERITGMETRQIERACFKLRKHGLIEQTEPGCLSLTDAGRTAAETRKTLRSGPSGRNTGIRIVRSETMRDRAWRAMRLRGKFSVADLIMLTAQGNEKNPGSNMLKYINGLTRAGILVELPRREFPLKNTSNGCKRWWLRDENNTGPLAPIVRTRHRKQVYDPNSETIYEMV